VEGSHSKIAVILTASRHIPMSCVELSRSCFGQHAEAGVFRLDPDLLGRKAVIDFARRWNGAGPGGLYPVIDPSDACGFLGFAAPLRQLHYPTRQVRPGDIEYSFLEHATVCAHHGSGRHEVSSELREWLRRKAPYAQIVDVATKPDHGLKSAPHLFDCLFAAIVAPALLDRLLEVAPYTPRSLCDVAFIGPGTLARFADWDIDSHFPRFEGVEERLVPFMNHEGNGLWLYDRDFKRFIRSLPEAFLLRIDMMRKYVGRSQVANLPPATVEAKVRRYCEMLAKSLAAG
jgi:hypothetical protein